MHRYVTSVHGSVACGGRASAPPYLHLYLLSPISVGLCISIGHNYLQIGVRDRQRDRCLMVQLRVQIALFLINSSHSLQQPWDLSVGGESSIFEAAIGYCCLWIVVGQESAPSPIFTLKPPLKPGARGNSATFIMLLFGENSVHALFDVCVGCRHNPTP